MQESLKPCARSLVKYVERIRKVIFDDIKAFEAESFSFKIHFSAHQVKEANACFTLEINQDIHLIR